MSQKDKREIEQLKAQLAAVVGEGVMCPLIGLWIVFVALLAATREG